MRKTGLWMVLVAVALTASAAKKKTRQVRPVVTPLEWVEKMNARFQQAHAPETDANKENARYHRANIEAYRLTGKAQWLEYTDRWARHNQWSGEGAAVYLALNEMNPAAHKVANVKKHTACCGMGCQHGGQENIDSLWNVVVAQDLTNASAEEMAKALIVACRKARKDAETAQGQKVDVVVENATDAFRQEVVELDAKTLFARLGIEGGRLFRVINAVKQEVPYQLTYDGKILIEASVRPHGTAHFTVEKGTPRTVVNTVYGRMYPERVDDIAWENDRGAYRLYGPALQKSGERAFGNDVWLKNTPDLENESRYFVELSNHPRIEQLKKEGKTDEAHALEEQTTYHFDHGHGLDCYKVGPSLGCGAPALMEGDKMVLPYCYKDYKLLDNGPLRFTVALTYHPTMVNGEEVVEHRILSLDKGSNFNRQTVWYEGATQPLDIASGVVIHNEDTENYTLGRDFVEYADPTDNPTAQNFQIYVGVFFPDGASDTRFVANEGQTNGIAGHALCVKRDVKPGERLTYYWGSAWSKYDVRNQQAWRQLIANRMQEMKTPLSVMMK